MASMNATRAREEFFDLVKDAIEKHQVHHIHHSKGDVVLLSEEEYNNLKETLELLSIPGFRESIAKSEKQIEKGQIYTIDDVFGK